MSHSEFSIPAVQVLPILPPQFVPNGRHAFQDTEPLIRKKVLAACRVLTAICSGADIHTQVCEALALTRMEYAPAEKASCETADEEGDVHDTHFHIQRVVGDSPRIFISSVLQAYREVLEERLEAGTSLGESDWVQLTSAFASILRYALWQSPPSPPGTRQLWPAIYGQSDPVRRWILGHHVFVAIIQGLILVFRDLKSALDTGRERDAEEDFEQSALLMKCSALAFRFASDFSPVEYEDVVRPTMIPPRAPPRFSGVLSADHRYFIKMLAELRPDFEALKPTLCRCYLEFRQAFQATYDAHKLVCARFSGDKQSSLLMPINSNISAVEELDKFKRARMKMMPCSHVLQTDKDNRKTQC